MSQDVGRPAIRYGVIFGLALGLIGVGVTLIDWLSGAYIPHVSKVGSQLSLGYSAKGMSLGWDCANAFVTVALLYVAGALASWRSGKLRSGVGAGLIAGSLGAIMAGIAALTIIVDSSPMSQPIAHPATMTQVNANILLIATAVFTALGACVLGGLYGAFLGFLGGSFGVARRRPAHPVGMPTGAAPFDPFDARYTFDSPTRRPDLPTF